MAKKCELNREQYKKVKRKDHKQMETFIADIYNNAYEEGKKAAEPKVKASDIAAAIMDVKGIGQKKAAEIMQVVNQLYEKKQNNTG